MNFINAIKNRFGFGGISKREIIEILGVENPVIFEAGANNGDDTFDWVQKYPKAIIHCFEPIPNLFQSINNRFQGIDNVYCYPIGFSDKPGEVEMFLSSKEGDVNSNPSSSSILRPEKHVEFHPKIKFDEKIKITVDTIDHWASDSGINNIDLMWLDMQGAEHLALRGAQKILPSVKLIYSEVSFKQMFEGTPLFDEYTAMMKSLGFNLVKVDRRWKDMGNALYERSK